MYVICSFAYPLFLYSYICLCVSRSTPRTGSITRHALSPFLCVLTILRSASPPKVMNCQQKWSGLPQCAQFGNKVVLLTGGRGAKFSDTDFQRLNFYTFISVPHFLCVLYTHKGIYQRKRARWVPTLTIRLHADP